MRLSKRGGGQLISQITSGPCENQVKNQTQDQDRGRKLDHSLLSQQQMLIIS